MMKRKRFDILRHHEDGSFAWIEFAEELSEAKARLSELSAETSGEYVVFDQQTQQIVASSRAMN